MQLPQRSCHAMMSPLFLLPRCPLRCRWRPGAVPVDTWSTFSPCGQWASGTAWRWVSPTTAPVAAAPGSNRTVPDAAGMGLTSAACVNATPATWARGVSARKGRTRVGTRTCAGRLRASPCAAGAASAAATSAPASRVSLGRSTGLSASVTTSPVPGTRGSSAQVGVPSKHICSEPVSGPNPMRTLPQRLAFCSSSCYSLSCRGSVTNSGLWWRVSLPQQQRSLAHHQAWGGDQHVSTQTREGTARLHGCSELEGLFLGHPGLLPSQLRDFLHYTLGWKMFSIFFITSGSRWPPGLEVAISLLAIIFIFYSRHSQPSKQCKYILS